MMKEQKSASLMGKYEKEGNVKLELIKLIN